MTAPEDFRADAKRFQEDGFICLAGFFSKQAHQDMLEALERFVGEQVPHLPLGKAFYEDKARPESLMRITDMQAFDDFFARLLHDERMLNLASAMLGDVAVPENAAMFAKAPGIGPGTPPHQDGNYFMLEPNEALTIWIPIDPADLENGCVHYVRGSHRRGLRRHERSAEVFGFSLGIADFGAADEEREMAMPVQAGDLLVHHSLTIHRTEPNNSQRQRRALGLTYFAKSAKPAKTARAEHTKGIHDEWVAAGRL